MCTDNSENEKILSRVTFILGDIIQQKNYDALVCPTNYNLTNTDHKKSIDYQVHKAAGEGLDKECREKKGCSLGEVVVTGAYKLGLTNNTRVIIHTVGPAWMGRSRIESRQILSRCYYNSMNAAKDKDCHSVIFPCIGLGHVGYAKGEQMNIALSSIYMWIKENLTYDIKVTICSTDERDKTYFDRVYSQYKQHGKCILIDDNSIALVLEGGGGKGAFQMGAWKMLSEIGIAEKVTGFSGTSVGAINTYLFLSGKSIEEQEKIWLDFKQEELTSLKRTQEPLKRKMDEAGFNKSLIEKSNVFSTVVTNGGIKKRFRFDRIYESWEGLNYEQIEKLVLGSAAHPFLFSPVKMDNDKVIDGGVLSLKQLKGKKEDTNIPIQPLYDIGYRKFIVIYTESQNTALSQINDENKRYGDARFCRIFPEEDLGNMAIINRELTKKRMQLGYSAVRKNIKNTDKGNLEFEDLRIWEPFVK